MIRITTISSVWIVDEDARMVTRVPRQEVANHRSLPSAQVDGFNSFEFTTNENGPDSGLWCWFDIVGVGLRRTGDIKQITKDGIQWTPALSKA